MENQPEMDQQDAILKKYQQMALLSSIGFVLAIVVILQIGPTQQRNEVENKNVMQVESHDYSVGFITPQSVMKSVVQISCLDDATGQFGYDGQGIIYAQVDNYLYIATAKHCLPRSNTKLLEITTIDKKKVDFIDYRIVYNPNDVDAGMIEVRLQNNSDENYYAATNSMIVSNKILIGDTAIVESIFNSRNIVTKNAIITSGTTGSFSPYKTEPGDSGSPVIGRYGVIGLVSGSYVGNNTSYFVPIEEFEILYVYFRHAN